MMAFFAAELLTMQEQAEAAAESIGKMGGGGICSKQYQHSRKQRPSCGNRSKWRVLGRDFLCADVVGG